MGRGMLVFKGEDPKKKKKKSKHSKKRDVDDSVQQEVTQVKEVRQPSSLQAIKPKASTAIVVTPQMKKGTGLITTSGTVVMGRDTRFDREVNVGDAILVNVNGTQEMRVVTMRLSNTSINLSSGFSQSFPSPVPFHYIPKPRNPHKEAARAQQAAARQADEEKQHAFGTYVAESAGELVYRERTEHGSYRIKKEKVKEKTDGLTRSTLLDMRAKKTSDKYC